MPPPLSPHLTQDMCSFRSVLSMCEYAGLAVWRQYGGDWRGHSRCFRGPWTPALPRFLRSCVHLPVRRPQLLSESGFSDSSGEALPAKETSGGLRGKVFVQGRTGASDSLSCCHFLILFVERGELCSLPPLFTWHLVPLGRGRVYFWCPRSGSSCYSWAT